MPDLRSVPDDTRWLIASQAAGHLVAVYDHVFRPALGERYNELEQEIWMQMAEYAQEIAVSLKLPTATATELAGSLRLVNALIFGPDFKDEVIEVGRDGAVIIIRRCPHLSGAGPESGNGIFNRCMAFTLSSQKAMNPAYTSRFVRAMCQGDRQCEIRVEPEPLKKPEKSPAP